MTTYKMLSLSTCHIPFNERGAAEKWAHYKNEYGWIFYAEVETGELAETAPVLAFILKQATKQKFDYVQLDGNGDVSDEFPTFTWPAKAEADKQEVMTGPKKPKDHKEEVVRDYCHLSGEVMRFLKGNYAADCFCCERTATDDRFQYETRVLNYIREAVKARMDADADKVRRCTSCFKVFIAPEACGCVAE